MHNYWPSLSLHTGACQDDYATLIYIQLCIIMANAQESTHLLEFLSPLLNREKCMHFIKKQAGIYPH